MSDQTRYLRGAQRSDGRFVSPHPGPLPWGEGDDGALRRLVQQSDAPYQYQAAEVSPFEVFEIWKRLNGRPETLTLAEKDLYEAVCRRLAVEVLPHNGDIYASDPNPS